MRTLNIFNISQHFYGDGRENASIRLVNPSILLTNKAYHQKAGNHAPFLVGTADGNSTEMHWIIVFPVTTDLMILVFFLCPHEQRDK